MKTKLYKKLFEIKFKIVNHFNGKDRTIDKWKEIPENMLSGAFYKVSSGGGGILAHILVSSLKIQNFVIY